MDFRAYRKRSGVSLAVLVVSASALLLAASAPLPGAQGLTFPPNGDNPQASVTQAIGPVRVTIDYSSPRVVRGGNDRRGKIWGELVPWGLSDLGVNGCASCPWRGGANENTTFSVRMTSGSKGRPSRREPMGFTSFRARKTGRSFSRGRELVGQLLVRREAGCAASPGETGPERIS